MTDAAGARTGRVVAVVAARDEEGTIADVVVALGRLPQVRSVLVVTDGCADRTATVARAAGASVLTAARPHGKGGALEAALSRVAQAEAYLLVDGDVAGTAKECGPLMDAVLGGGLDLAIGVLPPQANGGFGLVKRAAGEATILLTGFHPREPLSGQRAVRAHVLAACRPLAYGFGVETAMTIDAVRLGFTVGEIPVAMTHRPTGRGVSGFAHRAHQGVDILRAVVPRALGLR